MPDFVCRNCRIQNFKTVKMKGVIVIQGVPKSGAWSGQVAKENSLG